MQKRNKIEGFIASVSPQWAYRREQNRIALENLQNNRGFDAAGKGRRTSGWKSNSASANTENIGALHTLRDRSRDLTRNNPYAFKALNVIQTNTIGTGIVPTPVDTTENETKRIKKAWKKWAESTNCDFDGRLTFYGIQELCMRAVAESGEVLVRKKRVTTKYSPIGIQLQVLESDYLDLNKTMAEVEGGGYTIQGVEFDANGKRVAYWLYKVHPGESTVIHYLNSSLSVRIPADEIIHIYRIDRPGQQRGTPFGTSAMLRLHDFDDYEDAELIRQKIAACFSVFIQDPNADSLPGAPTDNNNQNQKVQPGMITHLEAGKTIAFADPPGTTNYGEYSHKIMQGVAAGYGPTYEGLTGDLSKVNFSSGRMGWLEFHRLITSWQNNIIVPTLCTDVWRWFIEAAYIAGQVKKSDTKADWTTPRREMIDPVKETTALTNQVRAGFKTWSEAVREQGYDPEEVIKEYAKELAMFDKNKIIFDTDMRSQVNTQSIQTPIVGAKNGE